MSVSVADRNVGMICQVQTPVLPVLVVKVRQATNPWHGNFVRITANTAMAAASEERTQNLPPEDR
ncbi:uncharacterized protein SETTUDRAFT_156465 [Exserohilum turcica Et28A]|uniref:Uncharacterized protein n=1 Tax=Exserohilum turcicum (strain 28A) TaxID=671987 RepID=R0IC44_EXST2|nr:uncharacterized protein SETTUDRAFT_156465 [Exserohilum turcica Et28A]EOA82791.1 hypothetical protein SETTUDRAFT_156465 [Exserohilum turcica Et28A]